MGLRHQYCGPPLRPDAAAHLTGNLPDPANGRGRCTACCRKWFGVVTVAALSFSGLVGCVASGPTVRHYSVRRLVQNDTAVALDTVEQALIRLGLTIERRDPIVGEIATASFQAGTPLGSRPAATPSLYARVRRVALVRIETRRPPEQTSVYCRVEIQEQSTQSLRMLSLDQRPSDVPDETPIQREAATTPEQNTVWQPIRRDLAAERVILERILQLSTE